MLRLRLLSHNNNNNNNNKNNKNNDNNDNFIYSWIKNIYNNKLKKVEK